MKTREQKLKEMGAISNEDLLEKYYGKKGTKERGRFDKEIKEEILKELSKKK